MSLKLIGSSLIEVLTGFSVLSITLALGMSLFQHFNGQNSSANIHQAITQNKNLLAQVPAFSDLDSGVQVQVENIFHWEREVRWWDQSRGVCQIQVRC